MARMNPRLELGPLDSILDAGLTNPALVATMARQMQRIAGRQAAAAMRRRRRAAVAGLHLATFGYSNLVASAVLRARSGCAGGGHRLRTTFGLSDSAPAA